MRIAVDLTAVPPRMAGVGYYLAGLVEGLQAVDATNEYFLVMADGCRDAFPVRSPRFSIVTVPDRSRPTRLLWEQVALPALLTRLGIEVLHSPHYTRPLRRLQCASVVGVMDLTYMLLPEHHTWSRRIFFRRMLPAAAARADRIIAISESTKRDAAGHLGIPADRIDAIPLAISAAYRADIPESQVEATRRRLDLPQEYVLFVGTLEPRKNLARLIRAYEGTVRAEPRVPDLVVVGMRGWRTEEFDRVLAACSVRHRVHIAGYV